MNPTAPQPEPQPPPIDRDLYCLTCGYNLRGLSGDPLRCPECGNLNPIGDVELPAEIITRQLRHMETSPALCVGAVICGAPLLTVFSTLVVAAVMERHAYPEPLICVGLPTFALVAMWAGAVARFRTSCLAKPGWMGILLKYHFWGLLLSTAVVGIMGAGVWLFWPLTAVSRGRYDALTFGVLMATLCLAIGVGVRAVSRRLHTRLTVRMREIQREVAVTIAREESRTRMAQQKRGLFR